MSRTAGDSAADPPVETVATQKVWTISEMQRRLEDLYALMDERSLDAVILTSVHNVLYYTGFFCPPFGRLHSAVIPRKGEPALIVSTIEDLRPRHCCYYEDIRPFHDWEMSPLDNNLRLYAEVLTDNGIAGGRLGYEEDSVSVLFKREIDRRLSNFELVDVAYGTMRQRLVKSEEELALIRQGVEICEVGGYAALEALRPGITETEAARAANSAIESELRKRFPDIEVDNLNMCWFQSGPYRSRVGHIMNSHRVVRKGEMLSLNPYAIIGGYYHVLERSLYWGHIPDEAIESFKVNVRAHHAGLKALKAGVKCSDIDKAINPVYEEADLVDGRSFGSGHSLGIMSIWFGREEGGELRQYNDTVLQENMVVTMEPMVNIDGLGGFRHLTGL
jgi:creatinase